MGERTYLRVGDLTVRILPPDRAAPTVRRLASELDADAPGELKETVPVDLLQSDFFSPDARVLIAHRRRQPVACVGADPDTTRHPHNVFGLIVSPRVRRRYQTGHLLLAAALRFLRESGADVARTTPIRRALPFFTGIRADPTHVWKELDLRVRWYRRTRDETFLDLSRLPTELREDLRLMKVETADVHREPTPFHTLDPERPVHTFRSGVKGFTLIARLGGPHRWK